MVKLLVEHGADLEKGGTMTPLHVAAGLGHAPVVQYLVEKGADINKA